MQPAAMLSLGLIGSKDLEPRDATNPVTTWYLAETAEKAQMMMTLDVCQSRYNDTPRGNYERVC